MTQREQTISRISHPDVLRLGALELDLVEDPQLDPLTKGDGLLGWEGDPRLALYIDRRNHRWTLVRLEGDGVYRLVAARDANSVRIPDLVPQLIVRLIVHDSRRGFNPVTAVNDANAALDAAAAKAETDRNEEMGRRLRFALRKENL